MKVQEVMTQHPLCCRATDTAQVVAQILRDEDIGSIPVIEDGASKRLIGIITDRDLCCSIVVEGFDSKTTSIEAYVTRDPLTCIAHPSLYSCQKLMRMRLSPRILVVDEDLAFVRIAVG